MPGLTVFYASARHSARSCQPKRKIEIRIDSSAIDSLRAPPHECISTSYTRVNGDPIICDSLIFCALLVHYPAVVTPTEMNGSRLSGPAHVTAVTRASSAVIAAMVILLFTHFHSSIFSRSVLRITFTIRLPLPLRSKPWKASWGFPFLTG